MSPDTTDPPQRRSPHGKSGKKGPRTLISYPAFVQEAQRLLGVAQWILTSDRQHGPIVFLFTDDAGMEIASLAGVAVVPMHAAVRAVCKARGAQAFIFVDESWMATGAPGDPGLLQVPPSRHPDRQECLTVFAVHPEGRMAWTVPFSREHNIVTFGKVIHMAGEHVQGGLAEALGEEGRP